LNARVFAVADAFDAMTSDRVYRAGRAYEAAVEELRREAGGQFDPRVVAAFRRVPAEDWERLRRRGGGGAAPSAGFSRARPSAAATRRTRPGNFGNRARIRHF